MLLIGLNLEYVKFNFLINVINSEFKILENL